MTWSTIRAKYLFRERDERAGDRDLPLLSVSALRGVVLRSELTADEPRADDLSRYKVCEKDDLVINRMSAYQGALGVSSQTGIVSPDYTVLRPLGIEPGYAHHFVRSARFVGEMTARLRGIGGSGQGNVRTPRINTEDFGQILVSLPPWHVQREIADFLDAATARIDALTEKKRRLMELLASRFAGEAASTILRGLDPVTGDGQLPRGWNRPRLGVALQLHRGFDLPQDDRREGAVPVVSSGAVSGWHDTAACDPPGVVTGRYGTVGQVHYVDIPYWPLNTTLFVSDFRGNHPRWVYHLLRVLPLNVDEEKSAVTGINRNVVGQLFVPLPPVAVQREIAAVLDAAETHQRAVTDRLEKQIHLLREHRQALIAAAVAGQLDLEEAVA